MIVLLRLISLIFVVSAIMLIGADLVTSLESGKLTVRTFGQVLALLDKSGMAAFDAWTTAHLPGFLDKGIKLLLGCWSWAVLGIPGILLAFLFGRRTADVAH